MTPSLDRAVEAAWLAVENFPGNLTARDAARVAVTAALPHLSPGVEKVKDWRWTLQKAVNWNAGHRCEYRVAAEAVIASMTAIIDNKQESSDAR